MKHRNSDYGTFEEPELCFRYFWGIVTPIPVKIQREARKFFGMRFSRKSNKQRDLEKREISRMQEARDETNPIPGTYTLIT